MSTHYIEEFYIGGRQYAIEDHEDGRPAEDHFFHGKYKTEGRFAGWMGGCGIGHRDTLEQVRQLIYNHATSGLTQRKWKAQQEVDNCTKALNMLTEPAKLFLFAVERAETPE